MTRPVNTAQAAPITIAILTWTSLQGRDAAEIYIFRVVKPSWPLRRSGVGFPVFAPAGRDPGAFCGADNSESVQLGTSVALPPRGGEVRGAALESLNPPGLSGVLA